MGLKLFGICKSSSSFSFVRMVVIELINLASSCSCTFICSVLLSCVTLTAHLTLLLWTHIHSIHARIANINEEQAGHWQTDLHSGQSWDGSHDDCDCSFIPSLVLSEHNKILTDCGQYGCAYFDIFLRLFSGKTYHDEPLHAWIWWNDHGWEVKYMLME